MDRPRRSDCTAGQMDGEAGWWTTSGNIGLPPLARAMGVGRQQQQIYNSWSLDCSENNTDNVFIQFQDHLEPHANNWLYRLHLQQIRKKTEEAVDNFVARIKLKAKQCGTRDNIEFDKRVITIIIAGVRYESVQGDLLTTPKTLTLQDAVQLCRSYEVSIIQLRELKDAEHIHNHGTYGPVR